MLALSPPVFPLFSAVYADLPPIPGTEATSCIFPAIPVCLEPAQEEQPRTQILIECRPGYSSYPSA